MRIAEEFERCQKCEEGWFNVEKQVLIQKGSPKDNPMHNKIRYRYICSNPLCGHWQYTADSQPE